MTKIFGLPTHPLLVHAPIVLAPLVVLGCLALLRPGLRQRFGWWAVAASAGLMVAVFLAKQSGESFRSALIDNKVIGAATVSRHADLGGTTFLFSVLLFLAVAATVVAARRVRVPKLPVQVLAGVAVLVGVLTVIWTIRTGHAGARVVWDGVLPE